MRRVSSHGPQDEFFLRKPLAYRVLSKCVLRGAHTQTHLDEFRGCGQTTLKNLVFLRGARKIHLAVGACGAGDPRCEWLPALPSVPRGTWTPGWGLDLMRFCQNELPCACEFYIHPPQQEPRGEGR